jgi:hypothetical protein
MLIFYLPFGLAFRCVKPNCKERFLNWGCKTRNVFLIHQTFPKFFFEIFLKERFPFHWGRKCIYILHIHNNLLKKNFCFEFKEQTAFFKREANVQAFFNPAKFISNCFCFIPLLVDNQVYNLHEKLKLLLLLNAKEPLQLGKTFLHYKDSLIYDPFQSPFGPFSPLGTLSNSSIKPSKAFPILSSSLSSPAVDGFFAPLLAFSPSCLICSAAKASLLFLSSVLSFSDSSFII